MIQVLYPLADAPQHGTRLMMDVLALSDLLDLHLPDLNRRLVVDLMTDHAMLSDDFIELASQLVAETRRLTPSCIQLRQVAARVCGHIRTLSAQPPSALQA